MQLFLVAWHLLLVANIVTTSKALVTTSVALVTTSKALATTSKALGTSETLSVHRSAGHLRMAICIETSEDGRDVHHALQSKLQVPVGWRQQSLTCRVGI